MYNTRDWVIYITDAGQANHFYMCFDAAKAAGWVDKEQRLDHIGKQIKLNDPHNIKLKQIKQE
jgi:arginyl-tRNA synthetase